MPTLVRGGQPGPLRRPVMAPLSDVTVMAVTGGDGSRPRSDADPCNPLLVLDIGSILGVNTLYILLAFWLKY